MCTSISFKTNKTYFGRNLDLNYNYPTKAIFVPRNYKIDFKKEKSLNEHYSILGVGTVFDNYPLFFDCINECGLSFAGLNFPGFATVHEFIENKINIAPYELPLYLLGKCKSIKEVKKELENISLLNIAFSDKLPIATLHFMMSDKENNTIVIESREDGLKIFDNEFNVLTNNPVFEYHRFNVNNYLNLTNEEPKNRFSDKLNLAPYGKGFGQIGLPGDASPASRFVKATYLLKNAIFKENNDEFNINQGFHILNNVSTIIGECNTDLNSFEYTIYSDLYDLDDFKLYIKLYENNCLQILDCKKLDNKGTNLKTFDFNTKEELLDLNCYTK